MKPFFLMMLAVGGISLQPCAAQTGHEHHQVNALEAATEVKISGMSIPDVALVNQDGESVRFYSDLVKGKVVALSFIFTTCTTICPPIGANFARLQKLMQGHEGLALISVSTDPTNDTPERLKAWRAQFKGEPGWSLLTGDKQNVDKVLKALGIFTPDKTDHTPFLLLGNEARGQWTRVHGFTAPDKVAEILKDLLDTSSEPSQPEPNSDAPLSSANPTPAHKYFTDVPLVDQHGQQQRLYTDLLKDRVVVINAFFSTCKAACPVMLANFGKLQDRLGDRLGREVHLISISVDPFTDTPRKLKAFADRLNAKPGWHFLTGSKENVDFALYKLGQYVEAKESHSNVIIIGNEPTGLWKKAFGLAQPEELMRMVEEVLNDTG